MVRLLISAVLLTAAILAPVESIADMLEAPHGGRHMAVGKIRRTSHAGSMAPGEIIRGAAEEDCEESSVPGEVRAFPSSAVLRRIASEGLLLAREAAPARSVFSFGANSARAPPLAS